MGAIGRLNFNGGTLRAGIDNPTFLQGITSTRIYSGGATIDTNGKNITIGQNLEAPTGSGLTSVAIATGGSGYVGAPIVTITGGGGTGATAVADFDAATGTVTGITITNAGSGYTSNPTVAIAHGFQTGGTAATLGTVNIGALTGGGLTKSNTGTLTLTGTNTYTGKTTVAAGTLALSGSGSIAMSSGVELTDVNSKLDVTGLSTYTLGTNQILSGHGSLVATGKTVTASGRMSAGIGGVGKLTVDVGTLSFDASSKFTFDLGSTAASDQIAMANTGVLSLGSEVLNWNDFTFNTLTGFGNGTYILIDAIGATGGTLGATLSGTMDGGLRTGTLSIFSNDLVLTVIPEPTATAFGLLALGGLALRRRR